MKSIFIIFVLLILNISLNAQLYLTVEPVFLRLGLLYNQPIYKLGVYGHAWYGDIKGTDDNDKKFYTENIKTGLGLSYKLSNYNDKMIGFVTYAGVNYNYFFNTTTNDRIVQLDRIKKVSFELGASFKRNRFTLLMMTDIINWESMVGVSYKLKVKPCPVYKKHFNR